MAEDLALRKNGAIRTLFATHYHELVILEGKIPGVHNMNVAITEQGGELVFMRRLVPGPSDRSYGIEVARLAGVPPAVVRRAKTILSHLEKTSRQRETLDALDRLDGERQTLLPCPELEAVKKEEPDPAKKISVEHPFLTVLRDTSPENITPLEAINLITEWKKIWT